MGARHPHNWKGGRTVASNGYVLIHVGKGHHLADVRGYAYEHRLVAEQKLGRRLTPGELAHHDNEIKSDNDTENIVPVPTRRHHAFLHRKPGSTRRHPDEPNQEVSCACGCGTSFLKFDSGGRPRRFVTGHNSGVNSRG